MTYMAGKAWYIGVQLSSIVDSRYIASAAWCFVSVQLKASRYISKGLRGHQAGFPVTLTKCQIRLRAL